MRKRIFLTKLKAVVVFCFLGLNLGAQEKDPYSAYLFTYFTGNGPGQEAIHFALSKDGFNYFALNNNEPVLNSEEISTTGGVRDPHILRNEQDGMFYMVVTDLRTRDGWDNYGMVLLKSPDLVNWTSRVVNIPETFTRFSDIRRVWAPQVIYDSQRQKYMVYFSMLEPGGNDIIYYAYANNDFTALETEPEQLFYHPEKMSSIDGDIIKKDGKFHLFFKTEGAEDKGIKVAVSDKLTSGYELIERYVDQTDKAVEGSGVFKMNDSDKYILMYDVYMDGEYQFAETKDLKEFEIVDQQVSMNFHPRHGSVLPITHKEAIRLIKAFPSEEMDDFWGRKK